MNKESILSWLGKTKTAARRVMSAYLKKMPVDVYMQDPKLQALCQFHPTRKFPVAAEMRFVLSARPPYNTKSLFFEARTGGLMDLSWVRCIENLYGSYTAEKNRRTNTLSALRNEVHCLNYYSFSPFIHFCFRRSNPRPCSKRERASAPCAPDAARCAGSWWWTTT